MVSSGVDTRSTSRSGLPISLIVFLAACGGGGGQGGKGPGAGPAADVVVLGGDVRTMDPARPHASAIAIRGDRIAVVGDAADVRPLIGAATRVIELRGETVTPGLVDGHCHLSGLGTDLDNISVRGAATPAAAAEVVAAAAKDRPGEWLIGRGWDQNKWPGQAFPTKDVLDRAIRDRPIELRRIDGHAVWVNSEALRRAKVDRATVDPAGGKILRDARGEPTGVLVDNAMALVDRVVPPPTPEVIQRRIRRAARVAVEAGLTGVHEMGIDGATIDAYRVLVQADAGQRGRDRALPLRVYAYRSGPADTAVLRRDKPFGDDRFAVRGVKFFADGALGSRGARLLADYADDPGNRGLWVTEPDALRRSVEDAVAGGWQVAIHAIGDAGNRAVLDAFGAALAAHPGDRRLRIEHVQVIALEDLPRLAKLGVIASMQPTHATSDMPWAEQRIGPRRLAGAYAWRKVLASGATLIAGSDFPVEQVPPLGGIYAAVTRQDPTGKPAGGWHPEEKMTLDEAIAAFTVGPAYAGFAERDRGRVKAGMAADLTIFDRPLVAGPGLLDTHVRATIVAGEIVFERGAP